MARKVQQREPRLKRPRTPVLLTERIPYKVADSLVVSIPTYVQEVTGIKERTPVWWRINENGRPELVLSTEIETMLQNTNPSKGGKKVARVLNQRT